MDPRGLLAAIEACSCPYSRSLQNTSRRGDRIVRVKFRRQVVRLSRAHVQVSAQVSEWAPVCEASAKQNHASRTTNMKWTRFSADLQYAVGVRCFARHRVRPLMCLHSSRRNRFFGRLIYFLLHFNDSIGGQISLSTNRCSITVRILIKRVQETLSRDPWTLEEQIVLVYNR